MTESYADIRPIGDFTSGLLSTSTLKSISILSNEYVWSAISSILYRIRIAFYSYDYYVADSAILVQRTISYKHIITSNTNIKVNRVVKRLNYAI